MQPVEVWQATARGVIELRFERNVFAQVVASAERRAETQTNVVVNCILRAHVHVLIANERADGTELPGELGVERGSIESLAGADGRVPDQETLVQEFKSSRYVHDVAVHDGLIPAGRLRRRTTCTSLSPDDSTARNQGNQVANLVMID